ncbi:MAG: Na/Pi symporter [Ferruginibacter sp.]
MNTSFDIWKMLAGIAFFLLALNFMETALKQLAGRKFKLFLKKQTIHSIKAIGGGAIVTALLQSSSLVNLLVLSMVGAGIIQMENALALMLGSNLGTTLSSWLIATLGFNFKIDSIAFPVAGIAGVLMAFLNRESKWFSWSKFLFGLAFLFVALGFIKSGMEDFVKQTDLAFFNRYPLIVFLLLGIALTAVVQSSSLTIAITLSALHTQAISLQVAMALVLGSEIGTSLKLFLAAANGSAIKKRVALGNFLFNAVTVIILFVLLRPVYQFITGVLHLNNELIALVLFQSFINILSVLLFFPFLKRFGQFLVNRFSEPENGCRFISKITVADPELAMDALENETRQFINHVMDYSLQSFGLSTATQSHDAVQKNFDNKTIPGKYEHIKHLHGEMHNFYIKLQKTTTVNPETERLNQLVAAIRNSMYAAKSIHDAEHDILQMSNSSNDVKYDFYLQSGERLFDFYRQVQTLLKGNTVSGYTAGLSAVYQNITTGYAESLQALYKDSLANRVSEIEISTLINFNRELYTFFKSTLYSLKDYLLSPKEAEYFDNLPGFIR